MRAALKGTNKQDIPQQITASSTKPVPALVLSGGTTRHAYHAKAVHGYCNCTKHGAAACQPQPSKSKTQLLQLWCDNYHHYLAGILRWAQVTFSKIRVPTTLLEPGSSTQHEVQIQTQPTRAPSPMTMHCTGRIATAAQHCAYYALQCLRITCSACA